MSDKIQKFKHKLEQENISYLLIVVIVIAIAFESVLYFVMGQNLISPSGRIELWSFHINGRESSQHITDFYTLSHIIHGILFYAIFKFIFPKLKTWQLLVMSLITEGAWELLENTDMVINRYRDVTIGSEYFGDSVLNSFCDIWWCALGFFMARKLPIWAIVGFIVAAELLTLYLIRDNLTLNIIMLLYPLESIKNWQMGA